MVVTPSDLDDSDPKKSVDADLRCRWPGPLVSIIIPVFNGSDFLKEAIDSAVGQTYSNCEVIVVNDGSDDHGETERIARSYSGRIIYIEKVNGGVASALNAGIERARGDFISWLSHDDIYYKNKIADQIEHLIREGADSQVIVYSDFDVLDEDTGRRTPPSKSRPPPSAEDNTGAYRFYMLDLFFSSRLGGCTLLIPASVFRQHGNFDNTKATTQDYHLWMRFHLAGIKFSFCPGTLVTSRHHRKQNTHTQSDKHLCELTELYRWAFDKFKPEFQGMPLWLFDHFLHIVKFRSLDQVYTYMLSGWADVGGNDDKPILWQYWENHPGSKTPDLITLCWKSVVCANMHDFRIRILSETDIDTYLPGINQNYKRYEQIAHKADYIRFHLLHRYGGVWLDSDTICLRSLSEIEGRISKHSFLCAVYKDDRSELFAVISFLAASKGDPICAEVIGRIESFLDSTPSVGKIQQAWDYVGDVVSKLLRSQRYPYHAYPYSLFSPFPIQHFSMERAYAQAVEFIASSEPQAFCQNLAYSNLSEATRKASAAALLEGGNLVADLLRLVTFRSPYLWQTNAGMLDNRTRSMRDVAGLMLTPREAAFLRAARAVTACAPIKMALVYLVKPCYRMMRSAVAFCRRRPF